MTIDTKVRVSVSFLYENEMDEFLNFLKELGIEPHILSKYLSGKSHKLLDITEEDANLFKLACAGRYKYSQNESESTGTWLYISGLRRIIDRTLPKGYRISEDF